MAGPKKKRKLKKKLKDRIYEDPGSGTRRLGTDWITKKRDSGFGSAFSKSALQGFAKLIKQGYSTKEAMKIMKEKE